MKTASPIIWKKSRLSNPSGNCVEVTKLPNGRIAVRDSKHKRGPVLIYTEDEMSAFVQGVKNGEFDSFVQ